MVGIVLTISKTVWESRGHGFGLRYAVGKPAAAWTWC
jgi:hypothetical protein